MAQDRLPDPVAPAPPVYAVRTNSSDESDGSSDGEDVTAKPVARKRNIAPAGAGSASAAAPPAAPSHPAIASHASKAGVQATQPPPIPPSLSKGDAILANSSKLLQDMKSTIAGAPQRPMFEQNQQLFQRVNEPNGPSSRPHSQRPVPPPQPLQQRPQPPPYHSELLEPEKAWRPATETNTVTGAKAPAKTNSPQTSKRKRDASFEVEIPDIDLDDKSTFDIVPASQKFKKFLSSCIRNGSSSFTRGDAGQISRYASKHSDQYFALKDGWTKLLKQLDNEEEIFKMWYAYDCLINMDEFKNPCVRATWEIRLPELIAEYMDMGEGAEYKDRYRKLLHSWRARLDPDTMLAIRKKLQHGGVSLADSAAHTARRFRYTAGDAVECLLEREGVWASCEVRAVHTAERKVVLVGTGPSAHVGEVTYPFSYAVKHVRRARGANGTMDSTHPAKRPRRATPEISSPKFA